MTDNREERAKQIQQSIGDVLLHEWDPIGVQDEPQAQDEYARYIGGVYRLLASDASDEQLVNHLWQIETVRMGLAPPDKSKLHSVVHRLRNLNVKL